MAEDQADESDMMATLPQPRPGGTQWWCPVCLVVVEATLAAADTETMLVDEAHCPNPHGEVPTLIGTVATERVQES